MIQGGFGIVRGFLRRGGARIRDCGVQWGQGLFIVPQFLCMERAVMVGWSLAVVAHRGAVIGHPSKILLMVILRPELIGPPPFGVVVVPVIVVSVSPMVSVTAVLVVRSLPGQVVGPIASRPVGVHMPPVPVVMVLVPVLLVLVVPVTAPGRVAVATPIVELSFPLPVASICIAKVSLVGVTVVISWMSMHLWAMGARQMRLLRVKVVRGMGLRYQRIPAGARGLWSKWFLTTNHVIFLLLLLLFLRSFLMSHLIQLM